MIQTIIACRDRIKKLLSLHEPLEDPKLFSSAVELHLEATICLSSGKH